jgi:phage I-like protein
MTAELGERAIAFAQGQADDPVIDYEHQTLNAAANGQPAPAAGWWSAAGMAWRDGPEPGLYATDLTWTPRAEQMLRDREYRYFSPVIAWDRRTGDVQAVIMGALTNRAGLDGLTDLSAAALNALAAGLTFPTLPEMPVDLTALRKTLALPDTATQAEIEARITALVAGGDQVAALTSEVEALKLRTAPDLSQYVPRAVHEESVTALRALATQSSAGELDRLIADGLTAGKIPGQATADWLRAQGIDGAKRWLKEAPVIAALTATQPTQGAAGAPDTFTDALKEEFGSREAWEAYTKANAAGLVKIYGGDK